MLTQIEAIYHSNLIKRKLERKDFLVDDYTATSKHALRTLKYLMHLLLLKPQYRKLKAYLSNRLSESEACLKLLLRVRKMYEAKSQVVRILRLMFQRERLTSQAELTYLTGRILSQIDILQQEHNVFRRPFIVSGLDYVERLRSEYETLQAGEP